MPPKRVLVVDDDRSILRLVATVLKRELYEVDTASGGREALARIEETLYDAIVLDLMMPDINGLDVLKVLQSREPRVKCVVILSAASPLDIADSTNPCVYIALRKPFDNANLIRAVRECLAAACDPAGPGEPALAAA